MNKLMTSILLLVWSTLVCAQQAEPAGNTCGEVITVETHKKTTTRYALALPAAAANSVGGIALVLLVGGDGHLGLDDKGCARALSGNALVRSLSLFLGAGFATALVDAPSDHPGEDGLAGFRAEPAHAEDLGKIITDVRKRTRAAQLW